jgi:hypothetical protein
MNETRETDFGFVLRTAAAWIERMRGEADDEDVAWMVAELRKLESETLPQLISERDALKADKERLRAALDEIKEAIRVRSSYNLASVVDRIIDAAMSG